MFLPSALTHVRWRKRGDTCVYFLINCLLQHVLSEFIYSFIAYEHVKKNVMDQYLFTFMNDNKFKCDVSPSFSLQFLQKSFEGGNEMFNTHWNVTFISFLIGCKYV